MNFLWLKARHQFGRQRLLSLVRTEPVARDPLVTASESGASDVERERRVSWRGGGYIVVRRGQSTGIRTERGGCAK